MQLSHNSLAELAMHAKKGQPGSEVLRINSRFTTCDSRRKTNEGALQWSTLIVALKGLPSFLALERQHMEIL